jgi:acyl transferase domain-containing protein
VAQDLLAELGEVTQQPATARMISTVTGEQVKEGELDAGYWYRNLRETVQFHTAASIAIEDGCDVFVEVSPHPVLVGPLAKTIENSGSPDGVTTGTLRRDEGDLARFLQSAAELEVSGVAVGWSATGVAAAPVALPTYDFERRRFWLDGELALPTVISATGESEPDDGTRGAALASLPGAERLVAVRELVQSQVRMVLRLAAADELDVESPLKELGFESVSAVDLTKRLSTSTGLRLSATLAFEHPTPEAISVHISTLLGQTRTTDIALLVDQLESALVTGQAGVETLARLQTLLAGAEVPAAAAQVENFDLDQASDDELFDIIDVGRNS